MWSVLQWGRCWPWDSWAEREGPARRTVRAGPGQTGRAVDLLRPRHRREQDTPGAVVGKLCAFLPPVEAGEAPRGRWSSANGGARVVGKPGRQQGPRPRSRGRRGPFPQSPHRAPFLHLGAPFCLLTLS